MSFCPAPNWLLIFVFGLTLGDIWWVLSSICRSSGRTLNSSTDFQRHHLCSWNLCAENKYSEPVWCQEMWPVHNTGQIYSLTQCVSGGWARNRIFLASLKKLFVFFTDRGAQTVLDTLNAGQYDCHLAAEQWQVAGTSGVCMPYFSFCRSSFSGTP